MIYDQLTRHYYRNEYNNHILIYFNKKALEIANKHKTELFIKSLDINDWSFYMLVYRSFCYGVHTFYPEGIK